MEIIYYIALAFILTKAPVIGRYVRLINTIIHEMFHILVAYLTGGKGYRVTLNPDTSGEAKIGSSSWISGILISYAGYTGSSLMAIVLFSILQEGHYKIVVALFFFITTSVTVLWVRNVFGVLWSISFVGLLWFFINRELESVMMHLGYLLSSVIFVESIISALQVLVISYRHPKHAGDATSLQQSTKIPAQLWGMVFFSQSIFVGYMIINSYIR